MRRKVQLAIENKKRGKRGGDPGAGYAWQELMKSNVKERKVGGKGVFRAVVLTREKKRRTIVQIARTGGKKRFPITW